MMDPHDEHETQPTDESVVAAWRAAESQTLPALLRGTLQRDADAFFKQESARPTMRIGLATWSGWLAAAAAALVAVGLWVTRPDADSSPTLDQLKATRTAQAVSLQPVGSDTKAKAEAIFDGNLQQGILTLQDLAPAPPGETYQLWIIDGTRDEADGGNRVDGGTFDVEGNTAEVPFMPRLPVGRATGFAVTLEPSKGSVVSPLGDRLILIGTTAG